MTFVGADHKCSLMIEFIQVQTQKYYILLFEKTLSFLELKSALFLQLKLENAKATNRGSVTCVILFYFV